MAQRLTSDDISSPFVSHSYWVFIFCEVNVVMYEIKKLTIWTISVANLKVPQSWIAADVFT